MTVLGEEENGDQGTFGEHHGEGVKKTASDQGV
jgi:hypothetical protein